MIDSTGIIYAGNPLIPKGTMVNRLVNQLGAAGLATLLALKATDPEVNAFFYQFDSQTVVDVSNADTIAGFNYFVSQNYMSQAVANVMLAYG
jgi:hypothetical protein